MLTGQWSCSETATMAHRYSHMSGLISHHTIWAMVMMTAHRYCRMSELDLHHIIPQGLGLGI